MIFGKDAIVHWHHIFESAIDLWQDYGIRVIEVLTRLPKHMVTMAAVMPFLPSRVIAIFFVWYMVNCEFFGKYGSLP